MMIQKFCRDNFNQETLGTLGDSIANSHINNPDNNVDRHSIPSRANNSTVAPVVEIFYLNQFHKLYKADKAALKKILKRDIFEINVKVKLNIYYKNKKVRDFVMKNNLSGSIPLHSEKSHVVYEFVCPERECMSLNNSYIGLTTCTLKERFTGHKYKGAIFAYYHRKHACRPELDNLLSATKILYNCDNRFELPIYEALFIRKKKPNLNENILDFTCLKLNIFR